MVGRAARWPPSALGCDGDKHGRQAERATGPAPAFARRGRSSGMHPSCKLLKDTGGSTRNKGRKGWIGVGACVGTDADADIVTGRSQSGPSGRDTKGIMGRGRAGRRNLISGGGATGNMHKEGLKGHQNESMGSTLSGNTGALVLARIWGPSSGVGGSRPTGRGPGRRETAPRGTPAPRPRALWRGNEPKGQR